MFLQKSFQSLTLIWGIKKSPSLILTQSSKKNFSSWGVIQKNEIEQLILNSNQNSTRKFVIVDVREPYELKQTGKIPTSVNIPLRELEEALSLDENSFQARYGTKKFSQEEEIIFSCKSGVRSEVACSVASHHGFKKIKNFKGSAIEWFDL